MQLRNTLLRNCRLACRVRELLNRGRGRVAAIVLDGGDVRALDAALLRGIAEAESGAYTRLFEGALNRHGSPPASVVFDTATQVGRALASEAVSSMTAE
jgi:hypothetical protein